MIEELLELLRRQTAAGAVLECRLRALELVVAAEEQRFVALALDELEHASDELAALELTRVLALSMAGLPVDGRAADLVARADDGDDGSRLEVAVAALRTTMDRVEDARRRAQQVVASAANTSRTRLAAATAFAHA